MRTSRRIILWACIAGVVIGGLWARAHFVAKRGFAERTACVGTLTRLRLAKAFYAQEHGLTNGAAIPDEAVWRENGRVEQCGSGGHYSINVVGVDPSCSYTAVVRWSGQMWRHTLAQ
jgi:hypothetical protein